MLMAHGSADPFVARELVSKFQQTLDEAGASWTMNIYGNVRHSFTNPGAGKYGMEALKYDAYADKHSWKAMLDFFREIFQP